MTLLKMGGSRIAFNYCFENKKYVCRHKFTLTDIGWHISITAMIIHYSIDQRRSSDM